MLAITSEHFLFFLIGNTHRIQLVLHVLQAPLSPLR
jgi:hypothetical protein